MSLSSGLIDIGSFIDQREDYRGGRPFIVGTGVTVDAVACRFTVDGMEASEVAEHFGLSVEQTLAALTFYVANRRAIDEAIHAQERENEEAAAEYQARFGRLSL